MSTWLIDSGHGGKINGVYQTAPNKMHTFPNGEIYYEGVGNRMIKFKLLKELRHRGIHVVDVCATNLDLPLPTRCDIVNALDDHYDDCVLVSLHSNLGGGEGFEVWTSEGETKSDQFAEELGKELTHSFPNIPFRADYRDGDIDKESAFYILKYTNCPAILPECLFYDNWDDFRKLTSPTFQNDYVAALVRFIEKTDTYV